MLSRRATRVVRVLMSIALPAYITACSNGTVAPTHDTRTSATGAPVTESIDGIPDDVPTDVVPSGADVTGLIAASSQQGSSAAEFTLNGDVDRESIADHARSAAEAEGWTFIERSYDAVTMVMRFTRDGATLTWSITLTDDGAEGAIIVVGN